MKVHKVTLSIIDFDEVGKEEIKELIEDGHYPNHCISPNVVKFETREIGEWNDDHPLNQNKSFDAEFSRIFEEPK